MNAEDFGMANGMLIITRDTLQTVANRLPNLILNSAWDRARQEGD